LDLKTLANLSRFKDIVVTLLNYGFDALVADLDLPGKVLVQKIHKVDLQMSIYERIRRALEDLGPTFVKFGQIMSLRPDLLPAPLIQELRKLQDESTPIGFSEVREVIERSLKHSLEDVFSSFEEEPIAAASLSQVHRAVLRGGGRVVAAKVQRPGIYHKIETDLDILEIVAQHLHERLEGARIYAFPELVRMIRRTLMIELDFTREARYTKIARTRLMGDSKIYVPEVYGEYCTEHLLVMEFIHGTRLKDLDLHAEGGGESLARTGLGVTIKQILEDGFFHADPHPGNVLVKEGGVLCLIDWGMVGRLTQAARFELIDLIKAMVDKDSEALMNALLAMSGEEGQVDQRGLERELLDVLDSYHAVPLKDLRLGQLLLDITTLVREFRLKIPADLAIMVKALVTAEGVALQLYPDLNVISEAEPYVKRLAARRFRPREIWRGIRGTLLQFFGSHGRVPRRLRQIMDKLVQGELAIRFEHENLGGLIHALQNIFSRLTFGIIIAAMIIGSSMIITTGVRPFLFGYPALGVVGYVISGVLGLWLIFNIIRTRRY
jgi:ubiquinone biosynthesis protein